MRVYWVDLPSWSLGGESTTGQGHGMQKAQAVVA